MKSEKEPPKEPQVVRESKTDEELTKPLQDVLDEERAADEGMPEGKPKESESRK